MSGKTGFNQKLFTNGLNIALLQRSWVEKTIYGWKKHWHFGKEKVLGAVFSKERHTNSLLGHVKDLSLLISLEKMQL